jgi:rubrerythrin
MVKKLTAIEKAVKAELFEIQFYEKILKTTTTPLGTSIFERLAYEEEIHHDGLITLHEEVKKKGRLPDSSPEIFNGVNIQDLLESLILSTADRYTISKEDLENIDKSLVLEEKVVSFYERLLDKEADRGTRALFELFLDLGHRHCQFLKDTKEFVIKAGYVE